MAEFAGPRWARRSWVRLLVLAGVMFAVDGLVQTLVTLAGGSAPLAFALGLVGAVLAVAVYVLAIRLLEGRRSPAEVARRGAVGGVGIGFVVGALIISATVGIIALAGDYRIAGRDSVAGAVALLGIHCAVGVSEELIFRAVLFRIVEQWVGTWLALVVSALVFGLLHLANPDATLFGALAIAVEAGFLLGAAYALTRTIWFAVGIHIAWNFFEGGVYGAVISGSDTRFHGLLRGEFSGSTLVSGGSFGPEASVAAIGVGVVVTVILLLLTVRSGRIVPLKQARRALAGSAKQAASPLPPGQPTGDASGTTAPTP